MAKFQTRIAALVAQIGGPRELERQSNVPHNTISGWTRKGGPRPSLERLWLVAYATRRSADWLLGFDVPELRSEGDPAALNPIRRGLVHDIAGELNLGATFVAAALPAQEDELRRLLVNQYAPAVLALADRKRAAEAIDRLRDLPRASPYGPSIGRELRRVLREIDAEREADERRLMMRLPTPDE